MEVTSIEYKLAIGLILLTLLVVLLVVGATHERLKRIEERLGGPTTREVKVPPPQT